MSVLRNTYCIHYLPRGLMRNLVLGISLLFSVICSNYPNELASKLKQLKDWHSQGLISEQEYAQGKARVLSSMSSPAHSTTQNHSRPKSASIPNVPVENLMAVIPFFGKVYSDGDRDTIAKFAAKNVSNYIQRKGYQFKYGVHDYHKTKGLLMDQLRYIDPDQAYSPDFLSKASEILKVRYLLLGKINHYSFDKQVYRFNVECMVYDSVENKIVFNRRARQSSRRKFFDAYIVKEKGKTIGKITEQFYFFVDRVAKNHALQKHPFENVQTAHVRRY